MKVIMSKLGPIPDHWFENDPSPIPQNCSPLSQYWLDRIAAVRAVRHGSDKYFPGDFIGGY
jgi:hypothetical protein